MLGEPALLYANKFIERNQSHDEHRSIAAHSTLGVIFVGLGIAEVNQYAVTHVLSDETTKATHGHRDARLIGRKRSE